MIEERPLMTAREELHRLVDHIPESDVSYNAETSACAGGSGGTGDSVG